MNKLYFIDSENVGNEWLCLLNEADENDVFHFFYTKNTEIIKVPCVELENIANSIVRLQLHRCEQGKNALDFQLATEIGAQIAQNPYSEFIIVSNDNGYDAVVSYWTKNNKNIKTQKTRA